MREWCGLQRAALAALRAELADLRVFVNNNVLNADEAQRVRAKLDKAVTKFEAVDLSSESLILSFEAESTGAASDSVLDARDCATDPNATTVSRETQVIGAGDVGQLSGAEILAGGGVQNQTATVVSGSDVEAGGIATTLPGTPPDTVQGSPNITTGIGSVSGQQLVDADAEQQAQAAADLQKSSAPPAGDIPAGSGSGSGSGSRPE